jgi:hypothetical protein
MKIAVKLKKNSEFIIHSNEHRHIIHNKVSNLHENTNKTNLFIQTKFSEFHKTR